jgi:uncharacterized integral membrane protein
MRILTWLVRGLIFFTLFAFALNNQQDAVVHGFFGTEWRAPMVIVVLAAFAAGCALGVLAMMPGWWRHRRTATQHAPDALTPAGAATPAPVAQMPDVAPRDMATVAHPPRERH